MEDEYRKPQVLAAPSRTGNVTRDERVSRLALISMTSMSVLAFLLVRYGNLDLDQSLLLE